MGKLVIHTNPNPAQQDLERHLRFAQLPLSEKLNQLFALIDLTVKMNGGKPIKEPQGKGIVLRKKPNGLI